MNESGNTSLPRFQRRNRFVYIAMMLWTLVLGIWIYQYSIRNGGMECWDGYERCAWGANIWRDLRHYDFLMFWKHTNYQITWPFLHSWATGLLFILFGPNLAAARLICLLSFVGSALLILRCFTRRKVPASGIAGVIAWGLFTTSPAVLQHSVSIMSELPGLFLILSILVLLPDKAEGETKKAWASGLVLGLLFLYKYNFAFLTYFALLVSIAFRERFSFKRLFSRTYLLVFGLPVLLLILWMIPNFNAKYTGLIEFAKNNPTVRVPFFFTGLFFYPRLIPTFYFINPYLALALFTLAAIAYPLVGRFSLRDPLTVCFLVHAGSTILHPMKDPRFIFISLGLLYIILGESVGIFVNRFRSWTYRGNARPLHWATVALFGAIAVYQYSVYKTPLLSQNQDHLAPIHTIMNLISPTDHVAFLDANEPICPPLFSYYLITALDRCQSQEDGTPPNWVYLFLFETGDQVRKLTPEEQMHKLRFFLDLHKSNKIITIQSTTPDAIARFDELFGGTQIYADRIPELNDFTQIYEKEFKRTKVKIRVFNQK